MVIDPRRFYLIAAALIAGSVSLELSLLAGTLSLGTTPYHYIHIALMAFLVASQFAVYLFGRSHDVAANFALFFAVGAFFTGVGDFVNGANSGVEPVSLKLSCALLLFGTGYLLYLFAMWRRTTDQATVDDSVFARHRYLLALPILAINVTAWFVHIEPNVDVSDLLYYGSFVFNASIYVAMPTLGFIYFWLSGRTVVGLLVFFGSALIPFSDLILFDSWLDGGDPAVPSFELYSYNWIVYFSAQVLIGLFPASVIETELDDR